MDDFNDFPGYAGKDNGCYAVVVELSRYWLGFTISRVHTLHVYIWDQERPERVILSLLKRATSWWTDVTFKVVSVSPSRWGDDPSCLEEEVAELIESMDRWTYVQSSPVPDELGERLDTEEELLKAELLRRQS